MLLFQFFLKTVNRVFQMSRGFFFLIQLFVVFRFRNSPLFFHFVFQTSASFQKKKTKNLKNISILSYQKLKQGKMANPFLVLAIAFVMNLLLFFVRGQKGDDIMVVVTGAIFISFAAFKVLVFKRDNPGKPVTISMLCGFDDMADRAKRNAERGAANAAAAAADKNVEGKKKKK